MNNYRKAVLSILVAAALTLAVLAYASFYSPTLHRSYTTAAEVCLHLRLEGYAPSSCSIGGTTLGATSTQFDVTKPVGTTCRFTWDTTGTNPNITANIPGKATTSHEMGTIIVIAGDNFTAANNGTYEVTGSATNYFEVTNAACVVESNKTIGATGSITYRRAYNSFGDATSQFDITEPYARRCKYTWDGTGTNPGINISTVRAGDQLYLNGANFTGVNKVYATAATVATDYVEIRNSMCTAEANKTLAAGYIYNYGQ